MVKFNRSSENFVGQPFSTTGTRISDFSISIRFLHHISKKDSQVTKEHATNL